MTVIAPLATTYVDARERFLATAASVGARVDSFPHPLAGLSGEALFVDVAEVGAADASSAVMVVSGTHGVEGYLGSALQSHHLETLEPVDGDGPVLIFVHALNPHGFSWVRRVNEDNVDLNRNFVDWAKPSPANPGYAALAETLVPESWTEEEQERTAALLMGQLDELGFEKMQQIVSGGQFDHPTGVFYGGTGPTWSNEWLSAFVRRRFEDLQRVAILDLHTGLGPWGHGELISSEPPDSDAYARQRTWWNDVTSLHDGSSVSAKLAGEWLDAVAALAPSTEITAVAIEYGTVDALTVLESLRADAVLHAHGDPTSPEAAAVRLLVREAFLDDDPAWLEACWPRYWSAAAAAIDQLR